MAFLGEFSKPVSMMSESQNGRDCRGRSFQVEGLTCENDLTKCFGTRTRNLENACVCGGTEISRGSVQVEKFGEVLWSSACDYTDN